MIKLSLVAVAVAAASFASSLSVPDLLPYRPPAVPLIVQSPFVSFWSTTDALSASETENWSGAPSRFSGLIRVDGAPFRYLGASPLAPPASQPAFARVTATRTRVTFSAGGVTVNVTFTSPRVLDAAGDVSLLTQPASFVDFSLASSDGRAHEVDLYWDADATMCTNQSSTTTPVTWERVAAVAPLVSVRFGAVSQRPLDPATCGQSVPLTASQTITWGWAYLVSDAGAKSFAGPTAAARASFVANGTLPPDDAAPPRAVGDGAPGAALAWNFSLSASGAAEAVCATFFFDEILAASYYDGVPKWAGNRAASTLAPLWRRDLPFNDTVGVPAAALTSAHTGAADSIARADAFDAGVFEQLEVAGGESLATFGSLVYRQVLGAFTLSHHGTRNETWALFKELGSGGDFSTVDVLYPGSPIFAALAPAFLRAALLPLLVASANTSTCPEPYVKHDLGKFPIADSTSAGEAMPLEETGNVMHMLAAIAMQEGGDVGWLAEFFAASGGLLRWRDFLMQSLPVVPVQGTTDDFLGIVANSSNLGVKGAVGLAAYGILAFMAGNATDANDCWEYAAYSSAINQKNGFFVDTVAAGGMNRSHWCWGWNACAGEDKNSSFLMYNFGYARILRMRNLFPDQAAMLAQEAAYYAAFAAGPYGIPLMNGSTTPGRAGGGVMPEWNAFFAASLFGPPGSGPPPAAVSIFDAFLRAANGTNFRAPATDYWDSRTASYGGKYRARPVMGGVFAPVAVNIFDAMPTFPHEAPMSAAFERGRARAG